MACEVICPSCGQPVRVDPQTRNGPPASELLLSEGAGTMELVIPGTVTSDEDHNVRSVLVAVPPPESVLSPPLGGDGGSDEPNLLGEQSFSAFSQKALPDAPEPPSAAPAILSDPLSVLNFGSTSSGDGPLADPSDERLVAEEFEYVDGPPRWAWVFLASYASALTVALAWMFLTGRVRVRPELAPRPATIPVDSRPDPPSPADRSLRLAPAEPIPAPRVAALGETIRLGALEFTPLAVEARAVILQHLPLDEFPELRDGGEGALVLHIKLHNLAPDAVFTPLEESFVREPDRGLPESFIETDRGDRIYIFPLARRSEWAIEGQTFPALRPGETLETVVVSQPGAVSRATDTMTWRLRLRTGLDQTEVVGVRFGAPQISRDGG